MMWPETDYLKARLEFPHHQTVVTRRRSGEVI
jgi:hypothetical protein